MNWHGMDTAAVLRALASGEQGLDDAEALARLASHGANELAAARRRTALALFFDQFRDFMIVVLLVAALIAGMIGEAVDAAVIVAIVILNAGIGFGQEYRAGRAMEALRQMGAPLAAVLRRGVVREMAAAAIVPGDVVVLEAGRVVPADMRLLAGMSLSADESTLTGESLPVDKTPAAIAGQDVPLADRKNMVFRGTTIVAGRGRGVVVATGMATELGAIAAMLQTEEETPPLKRRLAAFGKKLARAVLLICAVIFVAGVLRGEPWPLMLLTAIALAVAAIPEALPAVVTVVLAQGAHRMASQRALIRRLHAVETLGAVTCICTDKTGTLTENRMTVEEIYGDGDLSTFDAASLSAPPSSCLRSPASCLLAAMALNNDVVIDPSGAPLGDPTEIALYRRALESGCGRRQLEADLPRVAEIPFDAERKRMTTFHLLPEGGVCAFTKGALEAILPRAVSLAWGEEDGPGLDGLEAVAARMSEQGLRVLCFAMRRWPELPVVLDPEALERELVVLGLVGMEDPPRPEAGAAVAAALAAGIRPVMITGDHPGTARAIARRLGILEEGDAKGRVVTGAELERMSGEDLRSAVENIRVYARVEPRQKMRIVAALQAQGQLVAMTGDGVNDAPALRKADIGIAMGRTGTDVSREAAGMILLDDNFATIVRAVREGRVIYDNILKCIRYLLTTNSGEIWTLFLAPFCGLPVPLLPVHILWINLVTDGLPALALSREPPEGDVMARPPRRPDRGILAGGLGVHAVWVGLFMAAVVLGTQAWAIGGARQSWRTMVFTVMCLSQLGHVLAIRSERQSLFSMGICSNPHLIAAVLGTLAVQLFVIYTPALNVIFHTTPLTAVELLLSCALSSLVFVAVELEKFCKRRRKP